MIVDGYWIPPSGLWFSRYDRYITGCGTILYRVHPRTDHCVERGCVIHAPSDHSMRAFPTHWRYDRQIMERICPHGVGHPDPDDMAYQHEVGNDGADIHGCDGCCTDPAEYLAALDYHEEDLAMPRIGDVVNPPAFKVLPYENHDKWIQVAGPDYLDLMVDNDDVASYTPLLMEQAVEILNLYWRPLVVFYCDNEDCDQVGRNHELGGASEGTPTCPACGERKRYGEIG